MSEKEVEDLLTRFNRAFRENLKIARTCGALSGDEPPYLLGRSLLAITVDLFDYKELCADLKSNLEKFI
jgi:hypothetical protein